MPRTRKPRAKQFLLGRPKVPLGVQTPTAPQQHQPNFANPVKIAVLRNERLLELVGFTGVKHDGNGKVGVAIRIGRHTGEFLFCESATRRLFWVSENHLLSANRCS